MTIRPGTSLLHYRVVEKLGQGGMGEVWKAVDTTLDRPVAIKLLPPIFAQDPERLSRFEREAKLLASLNHPNIATVHGLHEIEGADGSTLRLLAMELVEGEDLSLRLARGPLPLSETLEIARQIAAALETAHTRGVVHRDLKPANVVLSPDGQAKVLDFGLAKALDPGAASASGSLSTSPTMTSAGTAAGMLLGTAAYMSPEQARGKPVDRRADLWALGCVIYECLTGKQLFGGETVSDTLAAVLRKDPDWSRLPAETPPLVRLLLRRCLTRDPSRRLQDAGDARLELEQSIEDPRPVELGTLSADPAVASRPRLMWLAWAVAALALAAAAWMALQRAPSPDATASSRLVIPLPAPLPFSDLVASPPAVSPDGKYIAFGITEPGGGLQLWLRAIDDFEARPLPNTEGAQYAFWSPDSRHLGFFQGGKLRRLELSTGRVQSIGGVGAAFPRGATWNAQGKILFAPDANNGIHVIDARGGEIRKLTEPDPAVPDSSHRWPAFLPDGDHYLFVQWTNDLKSREDYSGIYLASITGGGAPVRIVREASSVVFSPSGHLLVVRDGNLIALPFDVDTLRIKGEGSLLADEVLYNRSTAYGAFSASANGVLVYATGEVSPASTLSWFDRDGNATTPPIDPAAYYSLRLSPDARKAVVSIPGVSGDFELWIVDLERSVRTRLLHGAWTYDWAVWSSEGDRLLYSSQETGTTDIFTGFSDGSGEPQAVLLTDLDKRLFDWSRDGKRFAYWPIGSGTGSPDVWIYSLEDQDAQPVVTGEAAYMDARFSPDARFLAYASDESGEMEIFAQALTGEGGLRGGARWQVSTGGGVMPHWRDDGREIVYLAPGQLMTAVRVTLGPDGLELGAPETLFKLDHAIETGEPTGDHQRFLLATRARSEAEPLRVILNWPAAQRR